MAASKKAETKKTAKQVESSLKSQMKAKGLKMPHGYDVAVRKRKK